MNIDIDAFILSNSLEKHPVSQASADYKSKYITVLEYFVSKYSSKSEITKAMLKNYRSAFKCDNNDTIDGVTAKSYVKKVTGNKLDFKGLKLFTYRYCLLCDVFMLNAFNNKKLAKKLLDDIKLIFNKRFHKKIERLYDLLFNGYGNSKEFNLAEHQIECWRKNASFLAKPTKRIFITANMSAGKSTLINALIGKVINKTMNDACTSKIHYIYDKAFEDNHTHKLDYELNFNTDQKTLLENDDRNTEPKILATTYFNMLCDRDSRLCIIDTPGVNSATNKEHGELTKQTLSTEKYDLLVYVVNAENVGTEDDLNYLTFISENVPKNKVIFVLNKLDNFNKPEDSIFDSVENLRKDLLNHGFDDPTICPISSKAAFLSKQELCGVELINHEKRRLKMFKDNFLNDEFYDLSKYYDTLPISDANIKNLKGVDLLVKSGLYGFEQILLQRR